nr:MAG TPA: hypothetical protein [Caudoviricetes sp.]
MFHLVSLKIKKTAFTLSLIVRRMAHGSRLDKKKLSQIS